MVGSVMRAVFYLSILAVLGLLAWSFAAARSWQEVAETASKTQAGAATAAKDAFTRADRCFDELYKTKPPDSVATKPAALPVEKKGKK